MPGAYGPGGATNSFLQGAMGAAHLVHGIARDNRNDAENTRRYDVEQDRQNRNEQRVLDEAAAQKDTLRWQHMTDAAGGDPDKMVEMFGGAMTEMINKSPTFKPMRDTLLQGELVDRTNPMAGLVAFNDKATGKKSYSVLLNAKNPETGEAYTAPLSTGRGTKDPVPLGSAKDLVNAVNTHLTAYGLKDNKVVLDALEKTQGAGTPSLQRGAVNQAQTSPVAPATAPAAPVVQAAAAPAKPLATGLTPLKPASTSAPAAALPLPEGGMTATGRGAPAIAGVTPAPDSVAPPGRIQDKETLMGSLAPDMTGVDRYNGEQRLKNDKLKYDQVAGQLQAITKDGVRGMFARSLTNNDLSQSDWHKYRDQFLADPNFSKEAAATLDASFGTGEAIAALGDTAKRVTPGTVASEKQQDKLTANLPAVIPPALQQQAAQGVSQPVRNSRPNRDQLASGLILLRAGVWDKSQLSRYAKTGKPDKTEIQSFNPEHDRYEDGVLVQKGVPKVDAAARAATAKAATAAVSHYESSMKDLISGFNPSSSKFAPKYTMAGYGEYVAESFSEMEKMGIPMDPQVLAYNPTLKGVLATAYKEAVDGGKPPGWFTAKVRKPLHEAMVQKYPDLAKPATVTSGGYTKGADGKYYKQSQ